MMIHDITALAGRYKARKRVGRGKYGARGKTSGRGQKGAGSRSGTSTRFQFEGGQMPFFRRIPKFGFTNAQFKTLFWIVNIGDVARHPAFARGGEVNEETLIKAGLVRDTSRPLKVLGGVGEDGLKAKFTVTAERVSGPARKLIEGAGGKVTETGTRRDKVRGIDRNSDDRSPKNLTKKLTRSRPKAPAKAAKPEAEAKAEGKPEGKPEGKGGKGKPESKEKAEG
ncbi:MAG: 50S ribosomal protein L15 [Phycisphaerales bacterium]